MVCEDEIDFQAVFAAMTGETTMDFGSALAGMKAGHRLRREAWNGEDPGRHIRLDGVDRVVMVYEGAVRTYTPDSSDMLAEDWRYLNLPDTGDATAGDPLAQRLYAGSTPAGEIDGPTIPQETIDNGNATFVDTAGSGPVPVAGATGATDGDGYDRAAPHTAAEGSDYIHPA